MCEKYTVVNSHINNSVNFTSAFGCVLGTAESTTNSWIIIFAAFLCVGTLIAEGHTLRRKE
jgi:hypothetical protein